MLPLRQASTIDRREGRLLNLAVLFLLLYDLALSLAPFVRSRTLDTQAAWGHWLVFLVWLVTTNLAHRALAHRVPQRDPFLLAVAALLSGWGLLTIYRLLPAFGLRQALWLAVAITIFIVGLRLPADFRFLRRYKYLWLTGGLVLTGLTLFFGSNPLGYGPEMWLGCCGVYLQPSEPLKLFLIIYLAAYLADRAVLPVGVTAGDVMTTPLKGELAPAGIQRKKRDLSWLGLLAPTLLMTSLALLLLVIQRDLGTASIFMFLYAVMVYVASGRRRILLAASVVLALASLAGYFLFDVVRMRVDAWLNPWLDPSGRSYQIVQSLIAIANGGVVGRGPGLGNPGLVPVPHSDFIFASISEEAGLVGAIGLIVLIALLAGRGLRIAIRATDTFQSYLAAGLTAYLVGQSILIIAGNLRLLPLTGVTLPFVSYGGSSLIVSIISLLLLVLISNASGLRQIVTFEAKPASFKRSALHLGALLLAGLAACALLAGWWTIVRAPTLLARTDNPRRSINDRYVRRGAITDRSNRPINLSEGQPGSYTRSSFYADLGPVVGYTDPVYGQAGLEASMDGYLRGLQGNSFPTVWWNQLVYGQPPPGIDLRTSLDLDLQSNADRLLQGHKGALVLLNAQSGEVLAMASHPTFNPNRLAELGQNLLQNPDSPLLNRASQGLYPAGNALGGLLLARNAPIATLPEPPDVDSQFSSTTDCPATPSASSWPAAVQSGCPQAIADLSAELDPDQLVEFLQGLGLYSLPKANLPADSSVAPQGLASYTARNDLRASPLQIALAAASLSNDGLRPAPYLVSAANLPQDGWVILPAQETSNVVLSPASAREAAEALAVPGQPFWQSLAVEQDFDQAVSWWLGGTLSDWKGTPLTLVVLVEENNPALASEIGQKMMTYAIGR